jgi:hypothetical protein
MLQSCKKREVPTMANLSGALLRYSKTPLQLEALPAGC